MSCQMGQRQRHMEDYQRTLSDLKTQRILSTQIDLRVQITLIYSCDGWSAVTLARDLVDCDCIGNPALQIRVG